MIDDRPDVPRGTAAARSTEAALPVLELRAWEDVFSEEARSALNELLADFLPERRWFGAKAKRIYAVHVLDMVRMLDPSSFVLMLRVEFEAGEPDRYMVPLALSRGERAERVLEDPSYALARVRGPGGETGVLHESVNEKSFAGELLNLLSLGRSVKGEDGELCAWNTEAFERIRGSAHSLEPKVSKAEQSNTSIIYGDAFILKLYRRLEPGVNPDLEVGAYLTEQGFPHTPPVAGAIEYRTPRGTMTAAVLQGFVPNEGDAWDYALGQVRVFAERAEGLRDPGNFWLVLDRQTPSEVSEKVGPFLDSAGLLGKRTAEMHVTLARPTGQPDFAPEPLTPAYRRVLAERLAGQARDAFALLRLRLPELPGEVHEDVIRALPFEDDVVARCRAVGERDIEAAACRHHGDYHLGQVLWTGRDFVIIDFEGEPLRPLRERRMKRSPIRDVAGMLRSFDYASRTVMKSNPGAAAFWTSWVSAAFLKSYLDTAGTAPFVPRTREQIETILTAYLLEKATYEIIYELNHRPAWTGIPIRGMLQLIQ